MITQVIIMFDWTIWLGIIILLATNVLALVYNWLTAKVKEEENQ